MKLCPIYLFIYLFLNMSSLAPLRLTVEAAFWGYNTRIYSQQYPNPCFSPRSAAFSPRTLCGGDAAEVCGHQGARRNNKLRTRAWHITQIFNEWHCTGSVQRGGGDAGPAKAITTFALPRLRPWLLHLLSCF